MDIGIKFSDNDFRTTLKFFLKTLSESIEWHEKEFSKKEIVFLFNKMASGFYWMYQDRFRDLNQENLETSDMEITKYLQTDEDHIYIDQELHDFLATTTWENAEFHYVISGQVKSI